MASNKNKTVRACELYCDMCEKKHDNITHIGTSVGDGQDLAANIAGGPDQQETYIAAHMLYSTLRNSKLGNPIAELQAHHLICTESMDDEGKAPPGGYTWEYLCNRFGYNINDKENGVFLPSNLEVACAFMVPLHKGGHEATETDNTSVNYVNAVKKEIASFKTEGEAFCEEPEEFRNGLNDVSVIIFDNIKNFIWNITADGRDYNTPVGCMNCTTLPEKRKRVLTQKQISNIAKEAKASDKSPTLAIHQVVSEEAEKREVFCDMSTHTLIKTQIKRKYNLEISK